MKRTAAIVTIAGAIIVLVVAAIVRFAPRCEPPKDPTAMGAVVKIAKC